MLRDLEREHMAYPYSEVECDPFIRDLEREHMAYAEVFRDIARMRNPFYVATSTAPACSSAPGAAAR
jgi:hypothetical protein